MVFLRKYKILVGNTIFQTKIALFLSFGQTKSHPIYVALVTREFARLPQFSFPLKRNKACRRQTLESIQNFAATSLSFWSNRTNHLVNPYISLICNFVLPSPRWVLSKNKKNEKERIQQIATFFCCVVCNDEGTLI